MNKIKLRKDGKVDFDNRIWKVSSNLTNATLIRQFKDNGILRTDHKEVIDKPENIEPLLNDGYKLVESWNIKKLYRESMLTEDATKHRETATVQSEGLYGEGRIMDDEALEEFVETPREAKMKIVKQKAKLGLEATWKGLSTAKKYIYACIIGLGTIIIICAVWLGIKK